MQITRPTPDRVTKLRFNRFLPSIIQPGVFQARNADQMGQGEASKVSGLVNIPGIGWRLRPKNIDLQEQWETDGHEERPGTWAPTVEPVSFNKPQTLPGVTYDSVFSAPAMPMRVKRVASGSLFSAANLTADQSSFPWDVTIPALLPLPVTIDRLYVSDEDHEPEDMVKFSIWLPGSPIGNPLAFWRGYFCGPAGKDSVLWGFGQYSLELQGGGTAILYERGYLPDTTTVAWRPRTQFKVNAGGAGKLIEIFVSSDAKLSDAGTWLGKVLTFVVKDFGQGVAQRPGLTQAVASVNGSSILADLPRQSVTFRAPGAKNPILVAPIRVDGRRDMRLAVGVYDQTFEASGFIEDQPFDLGVIAVNGPDLFIDYYVDRPTGTSATFELRAVDGDAAGDVISGTTVISDNVGVSVRYALPTGFPLTRSYRVKVTLNSNVARKKTPTLKGYVVRRAPLIEPGDTSSMFEFPYREPIDEMVTTAQPTLPARVIRSVSITGPSADPNTESAQVDVVDLLGDTEAARERSGTPVDIEVETEAGVLTSRLFRGVIQSVGSTDLPSRDAGYPGEGAWRGDFSIAGEYRRLNRRLAPGRIVLRDTVSDLPLKVTDAIDLLLEYAGVDAPDRDIPDLPIRLLAANQDDIVVEPATPLGDVIQQLVSDYLGGILIYCENSGANGQWKILQWPRPPYNIVLRFDPYHPGGGAPKLRHLIGSYGSTTSPNGQVVQTLPMFRTRRKVVEPPEGNMVVVIGGSVGGSESSSSEQSQLVQVAVNVRSFNALGLDPSDPAYPDPTHPDFMREAVPIEYRDATLSTPAAVNFVTRRIYDASAHARETLSFNSLLPFIDDVTDAGLTRPRPPRIGDMVEVRQRDGSWKVYAIVSCNPRFTRSGVMRADYELVHSSRFDKLAVPIGAINQAKLFRAAQKRIEAAIGLGGGRFTFGGNSVGSINRGAWAGLPAATVPPIQDLDPSSPNFGEFFFMPGYDPVT